jgi:photosystem II stability/assembly factor-like uncharacterized protein
MKKLYISICLILVSLFAFPQWIQLTSGTNGRLRSVFFTDQNTGYAVKDEATTGVVYKTTNAGNNWASVFTKNPYTFRSVYFTSSNTGYLAGGYCENLSISGLIYKTTNGGTNWYQVYYSTASPQLDQGLNSLYFVDANIGYAAGGAGGVILKTTNAGLNWAFLSSGTVLPFFSICFAGPSIGYTSGAVGRIYKTTNGGNNWSSLTSGTTNDLYSLYFTDANTGYVFGDYGTIKKTTDGGTTWSGQTSGINSNIRSSFFTDTNIGYAVGGSTILKTTNGGANWFFQYSGTTNSLESVYFIDNTTGYIVGWNGTILKTTNAGVGFSEEKPSSGFDFDISPNPARDKISLTLKGFQTLSGLTLAIYDMQGRLLLNKSLQQNNNEIDISKLQQGVYMAMIKLSDGGCLQQKFVVIK